MPQLDGYDFVPSVVLGLVTLGAILGAAGTAAIRRYRRWRSARLSAEIEADLERLFANQRWHDQGQP